MIQNIKARFKAQRFNIWTEKIDPSNKEGYYFYNGKIYFGCRWGVFFESSQILFSDQKTWSS
jgi:hypothetical protein